MTALPMFPLGSVLFPYAPLPLHVFEPRYRRLVHDCLAGDREFGVVLIERGSEVGGGETRFDVGTKARIEQAAELEDGRWALVTWGVERIRVRAWLPDDPYPHAEVETVADPPEDVAPDRIADVTRLLRRVLALRAELHEGAARFDVELSDDPVRASFEAAILAAPGPLDAQRLLELDGADARLARVATLLDDEVPLLELLLAGGGAPGGGAVDG